MVLINNHPFRKYIDSDFSPYQLSLINLGLVWGIEPSTFAHPNLSDEEMEQLLLEQV